jgi:hypothetical protein
LPVREAGEGVEGVAESADVRARYREYMVPAVSTYYDEAPVLRRG